MMKRIAIAIWSLIVTAFLTANFCAMRPGMPMDRPPAVSAFEAAIGIGVGLLAAFLAWQQYAPDDSATADNWGTTRGDTATQASDMPERLSWLRGIVQFGVLLILGTAMASVWTDPPRGADSLVSSVASLFPGLLIASFAFILMQLDALRKRAAAAPEPTDARHPSASAIAANALSRTGHAAAGGLGATMSATARGMRGGRQMFAAFRAGGASAPDKPDWAILLALFATGCVFFAIGLAQHAGPAILIAAIAFGAACGVSLDHSMAALFRLARMPTLHDLGLLLLCILPMLFILVAIEMAMAPPWIQNPTPLTHGLTMTGKVLNVIGQLLVAAPLLAALVRPALESDEPRPLWPLLAGFFGGEIALLVLTAQWSAAVEPAFQFGPATVFRDWRANAANSIAFPPLGLLLGAGLAAWFQALTAHRRQTFDWDALFPASIRGCMALMALGALGCLITATAPTQSWHAAQAEAGVVTGLVWLYALWRIEPMRPASAHRALLAWVILTIIFYCSALAAILVGSGNEWAALLIIFTLPIAIASWLLTVTMVPRLMRWVLGDH